MTFQERRIQELKKEIIQDYEVHSHAKRIFHHGTTSREEPGFTNIYQRPLVDRVWFTDPGHYPAFGSFGGTIARGEVDFVISSLKRAVEVITVRELDFTPEWLGTIIPLLSYGQNEISFVGSVENMFQKIISRGHWNASYDDITNGFKIAVNNLHISLHPIIKEIVGDNILILNKDCCRVKYRQFHYPDLATSSTLFVDIKPYNADPQKMDILVHSTVKFDLCNRDLVRIFLLESTVGEPFVL
jgi:hypothetical protein